MLFVKDALICVRKAILANPFTQHLPIYFHAPLESDFPYLVLGGQKARAGFNEGCFDLKMTLFSLNNQNFVQEDLWHPIEKTLIQKNGLKVFFKGASIIQKETHVFLVQGQRAKTLEVRSTTLVE